ncbi:MAG: response regulator transcription factor [Pseudomonadales bacterium]|nr:response regulator transcription factor [Pseudomonadales bacterium]
MIQTARLFEPPRVLVVDDEPQIRHFLRISLKTEGYQVVEACSGEEGLGLCARQSPDLVILDLGLPDVDGATVLQSLREWSTVPVIVLSVRDREQDKVQALDLGANDYVTKPFGVEELLARVRSQLRTRERSNASHADQPARFDDGDLCIDLAFRTLTLAGDDVHLTPKEFAVLKVLLLAAGRIVTQSQLLKDIWGPTHTQDTHYLRIVIRRLRQKLGDDPTEQRYIQTEPGVGYRFVGRMDDGNSHPPARSRSDGTEHF